MEALIEDIASQAFGAKWQQLYHRLGLQYRDRYRIAVEHKDEAEADRIRCCVKDTVALWLKSPAVMKQSEREKMKILLDALNCVQGFEAIALELSHKYDIHLEKEMQHEQRSVVSLRESSGSSIGASASSLRTQFPDHEAKYRRVEYDGATPWTEHEAPPTDSSPSQAHHGMKSSILTLTSDQEQLEEVESSSSFSVALSTSSETAAKQEILQVQIDMSNTVHKFAVLDVVQRISLNHWTRFSSLLGLSKEIVESLSREKAPEERYYKSIKEWLKLNREGATFAALDGLLEQCNERRAQIIMRKRLECNRNVQV